MYEKQSWNETWHVIETIDGQIDNYISSIFKIYFMLQLVLLLNNVLMSSSIKSHMWDRQVNVVYVTFAALSYKCTVP